MGESLPKDTVTGESTPVARDYDVLTDGEDPRARIELAPAGHTEACDGNPDDYVLWLDVENGRRRYRITYDQGGHIIDAMFRALKQTTNTRGIE